MPETKSHEVWITDEQGEGLVRVHVMEFADGQRVCAMERQTFRRKLAESFWGTDFRELFCRMADELEKLAARVRDAAPNVQAVMDSAEVNMDPYETATAGSIARYLVDQANALPPGAERDRLFDLSDKVRSGEWWRPS